MKRTWFCLIPTWLPVAGNSEPTQLFSFSVLPTAAGGQYIGTYELDGGVGAANQNNFDFLGSQIFTINVPTVAPEPASVFLLACGLILFWLCGHSRRRRVLAAIRPSAKAICYCAGALVLFLGTTSALRADAGNGALIVTASNSSKNQLLVYNSSGQLIQTLATQGAGGVSGNSGGIEVHGNLLAVVNFASQSVSVFQDRDQHFELRRVIHTASKPVSVAFGADHLYILGATTIESHHIFYGTYVDPDADGVTTLLKADGSAAQVGFLRTQLIVTEKSNMIETVGLFDDGAVEGPPVPVQNIPANVNAPFGLVTRGNNAYVTIAHADEIGLVRNGAILTITGSGTQHAPCWLTLSGPFLFSSNSPSMSISRYAVYGQKIVQDAAVAAKVNGAPTDIASSGRLLAVIDGNGQLSHLSIFKMDEDGNLTLKSVVPIAGAINGVAVARQEH